MVSFSVTIPSSHHALFSFRLIVSLLTLITLSLMGRPQHNAKQVGYRRRDIRRDLSEGDVLVIPAPLARGKEATSVAFSVSEQVHSHRFTPQTLKATSYMPSR
jgi:hypothetical protein